MVEISMLESSYNSVITAEITPQTDREIEEKEEREDHFPEKREEAEMGDIGSGE